MVSPATHADVLTFFHFWPSRALCIVAMILFLLAAVAVLVMTIKTRQWYIAIAAIVGFLEMAGFISRLAMIYNPEYGVFILMNCLLVIPPSFLALVQYVTLGKVVDLVKQRYPEKRLLVKPKPIIWGFFILELAALACQGAGAGTSVSADGPPVDAGSGKILLIVGLALLVFLIAAYLVIAICVQRNPKYGVKQSPNLRRLFPVLYACTILLLIRNIFRLVEFSQGWYGPVSTREKYFYTLDSLMILLILVIMTIFHFGLFLKAYPYEVSADNPNASNRNVEVV